MVALGLLVGSLALFMSLPRSACAAQMTVLFDFDNAPAHANLPIDLTVDGLTAHLSSTGQGFSIQAANAIGFTPVGFAGNCVYPNSIDAADLHVSFSQALSDFSILYAPEEYACDSSATMRVTAYMDNTVVGSSTMMASPGTWPTATLAFSSPSGFNNVVVHYDSPPPTGGDYGTIFMADNMSVTTAAVNVPETMSTGWALLMLAGLAFAAREWSRSFVPVPIKRLS